MDSLDKQILIQGVEWVEKILLWVVIILVIFDIYLYLDKVKGNTISNILHKWVYNNGLFFIPYTWGVLGAHFFLGTDEIIDWNDRNRYSLAIVIGVGLVILIIGSYIKRKRPNLHSALKKPYVQLFLLVFGAIIGHFFWSLEHSPNLNDSDEILRNLITL